MRMKIAVLASAAAAALTATVAAAAVSADDPDTASCTAAPRVDEVPGGSQITVECTVPRPPPVTVTVTATPEPSTRPTTDPSTTPTSTPTSTPTPPPVTGWPGASNTGVPAGIELETSGSVTVTTNGTVIDGLDINGSLTIRANNVVVKNTRIRSNAFWPVTIGNGASGVVLQDIEVDGGGATAGASGIVGPATIVRADVHGVENGLVPGSGSVIRASWIHDLASPGSPHYDGIQIDGDLSGITITGNHVDLTNRTQTAAVMIDNYYGPISGITVVGNLLRGGGYTVYADGQFSTVDRIVGVIYSGNRLGKGYYGYGLVRNASVTWTGNVDHATGATVNPGG